VSAEVLPSWLRLRPVGTEEAYDPFRNELFRNGEVVARVYPEDPRSLTKQFIEYDVAVPHYENGTASTKIYHQCLLANDLAGLADRSFRTLRVAEDGASLGVGNGSKVTVLCLHGQQVQAVIVGGIRDERDSDRGRQAKGHHLEWEWNGVRVEIRDDGSLSVERRGPTDAEGGADTSRGENPGARIDVAADGGITAKSSDGKQSLALGADGKAELKADEKATVDAGSIELGGSREHLVLGDTYRQAQAQLHNTGITAALNTLIAACVPGSPLSGLAAGFGAFLTAVTAFEAQAATFLSRDVTTK